MSAVSLILRNRYRIVDNHLRNIGRHVFFHLALGLGILAVIWGGGMWAFSWTFDFLSEQEPFGPPLIHRLMNMVLMAFFSMLIFSNLIVTLSTTYVSREVAYFMSLPLGMGEVFWSKLVESTIYSSWAFALLSLPAFIAYGEVLEAGWTFYPALVLLLAPFIAIPAVLGSIVTMLISAYVSARRARTLAVVLGAVSVGITVLLMRVMGGRAIGAGQTLDQEFSQLMSMMSFGAAPVLPNVWLVRAMKAAAAEQWGDYLYWWAMLASTALAMVTLCAWLIGPLYYRGWALARDSGSAGRVGERGSIFDRFDRLLRPLPDGARSNERAGSSLRRTAVIARALIGKDLRVFWRDPVQWSQLLILFGLLFIYMANIRGYVPVDSARGLWQIWQSRLSFINMGAVCFILSILTTRFVYPMLSLEGKEFWVIGLAPIKRSTLVWEKYWLCWTSATLMAEVVMVCSCFALRVDAVMFVMSAVTVLTLSFGLTSLAVGLGAMTPNFDEDNPARIANGLGGTMNVILSMFYIGATLGLEGVLYLRYMVGRELDLGQWDAYAFSCAASLIVLHTFVIVTPMWLGLRRWREMEF